MIAFRAKPALVLGLCLLFSYSSLASISPSITLSAANDRGLDNILQRTAAQDGSSAETSYDYDSAPWQPNPSHHNIDEAARYEDLPPSVFSPTGRLHPVEAVVRASKARTPLSNLLVAMVCRDGLLVVSTLPISPNVDASKEMSNEEGHASDDNSKRNGESSSAVADKSENDDDDSVVDTTSDDDDEALQSPSLFLFDETCISTGTGSIFDIHPCIVGATAGNAVDNRIMRTKLLALGLNAMDHQGSTEQDVSTARVAKDLANQLQVTTQDIAAAQKQKLGRMLACSAVLLGSRQIWRIDPTGQFWDCHAAVLGGEADQAEQDFFKRLSEECENNQSVPEFLGSISQEDALTLVQDFLEKRIKPSKRAPEERKPMEPNNNDSEEKTKDDSRESNVSSSQVYWQATILDYSSLTKQGTPKRKLKRGVFGV